VTAVDGRPRTAGPKSAALHRYVRTATGLVVLSVSVTLLAWLIWATQDPYEPAMRIGAAVVACLGVVLSAAFICARLVIGAMHAAAEAAGE